jgi:hypothetical protein
LSGDSDTISCGDTFDGNEGADIGRAEARMFACVVVKIDMFGSMGDGPKGGFGNGRYIAYKCNDRAIVVGIGAHIQDVYPAHAADLVGDTVVDGGITAVTEIRNTFNNLLHGGNSPSTKISQNLSFLSRMRGLLK